MSWRPASPARPRPDDRSPAHTSRTISADSLRVMREADASMSPDERGYYAGPVPAAASPGSAPVTAPGT
ncbi:hypothetical protein GKZ68_00550 [Hymenobacter sp. BRD128]|uniref:hypothetical protein n=1 Tax=Hymenobacter sp. BRD128 TaxID=2675878 RepID=UPI00156332A8|nr:hypothetical protein [Hymenobacter sp. BRD128]QKG55255.1 hypothetical protein GKZ68_00550 [Hymenobacter sp. BRD128]